MKKVLRIFAVVILLSILVFGCGSKGAKEYNAMQENHAATKTYRDGIWRIRYNRLVHEGTDRLKCVKFYLTVDVIGELSEEDMLDIMDYYEFTKNSQWDVDGNYIGERETDYICYAVFYKGETDEEICRMKYCNREAVEILEEEQGYFPASYFRSDEEEIGEDGINGPLP